MTLQDPFEHWLAQAEQRYLADLTRPELGRALGRFRRATSSGAGNSGSGHALDGRGKRAAFALYYAPLHFLTVREIAGRSPTAPASTSGSKPRSTEQHRRQHPYCSTSGAGPARLAPPGRWWRARGARNRRQRLGGRGGRMDLPHAGRAGLGSPGRRRRPSRAVLSPRRSWRPSSSTNSPHLIGPLRSIDSLMRPGKAIA